MDTVSERVFSMADINTAHDKLICDAALKLFREKGYDEVSVNDICREAGIARSTFYLTFPNKKEIVVRLLDDARLNREDFFGDFVEADNDFERMWILCNRYLTVVLEFGPELTATIFELELMGELNCIDLVHKIDEWMIKLCRNAQKAGIILCPEPAEIIAPLSVSTAYYTTYEWAQRRGKDFDLRQVTRVRAEAVLNVAQQYRMSEDELKKL